jgi:uncharacterized phiE125 gp8 family phage protein
MAGLQCLTPPSHEPVEVVEMKEFLRVTAPAEDRLISTLIREAREQFDGPAAWFNRALITQTWQLTLDAFPLTCWRPEAITPRQYAIVVPLPPLQSVGSITYVDAEGATQTLSPTAYQVDTRTEPGEITPAYGNLWPAIRPQPNAVTVTFTAGYGAAPKVPEPIKVWIKQAVAYRYDNRSMLTRLPTSFFWTMASYKTVWSL